MDGNPGILWKFLKKYLRIILRSAPKAAAGAVEDSRRGALIPYPRLLKPVDWKEFEQVFEKLAKWLSAR
jgi:hypothetical protein